MKHEHVITNNIRLHCVTAGEGPLVLLLHGFPECWYSWRHQLPAIAAAGFKVVAPDLRGYNDSERPAYGYEVDTLARDVIGLMDWYGVEKAVVAGHDWGGAIAWQTAMRHPERVERLIALNIPHPTLLARALRGNIRQMMQSSYILFFKLPYFPEAIFRARNGKAIERIFRATAVHPEQFTDEDIAVYKEAARKPGAMTAMLQYYRSLQPRQLKEWARGGPEAVVHVPTLMIWGEQDVALRQGLTVGTDLFVPDLEIRTLPDASHWVQQDQPAAVTGIMVEFLM